MLRRNFFGRVDLIRRRVEELADQGPLCILKENGRRNFSRPVLLSGNRTVLTDAKPKDTAGCLNLGEVLMSTSPLLCKRNFLACLNALTRLGFFLFFAPPFVFIRRFRIFPLSGSLGTVAVVQTAQTPCPMGASVPCLTLAAVGLAEGAGENRSAPTGHIYIITGRFLHDETLEYIKVKVLADERSKDFGEEPRRRRILISMPPLPV